MNSSRTTKGSQIAPSKEKQAVLRINVVCYVDLVFSSCRVCEVSYTLTKAGNVCKHGEGCSGGSQLPAQQGEASDIERSEKVWSEDATSAMH